MSFRVVAITKSSKLDLKINHLIIRNPEITKIHISEIAVLLIESTAVSITCALMCELVKNKVKIIFCDEKRNPISELAPYYGSHDTSSKISNQIKWDEIQKKTVWTQIVAAKIQKQCDLLKYFEMHEHQKLEFTSNEEEISISKNVDFITDIFNININQAKYLNKLYSLIKSRYVQGDKFIETMELNQSITDFMGNVCKNEDYNLEYSDQIDLVSLFKALNLSFVFNEDNLIEKLVEYISILNDTFNVRLFIINQLLSIFTVTELEIFNKVISYKKINVLTFESSYNDLNLNFLNQRIIDNDLCVID